MSARRFRYLSTFSGIEAASVAWEPLGWKPVGFSEVAPFPSAVLAARFPDVPNLGDITLHKHWPELGHIDLICGGSPCQAFSVAGLRRGLLDPRGQLALTFLSLVDRLRPQWVVWENVANALQTNNGRDFGALLGALGKLGYGFAYRVLDASKFGVAQRRRRVFLVANARDWRLAASVLFEPEGSGRYPAKVRPEGLSPVDRLAGCAEGGCFWNGEQVTQTLDAVLAKAQTMPEKSRFPAVLVPDGAGGLRIRFLTVLECERLQGFPDDWTLIPYRGRVAPKTERLRAIGNSMATPVMRWIGERINAVHLAQSQVYDPSEEYDQPPFSFGSSSRTLRNHA